MVFYERTSDVADIKNTLWALTISFLLIVSFIKLKLFNISDQRILSSDEFHMRALDNGVHAAAAEAKLTDLSGAGRELQLAPGEMSSNEENPQPKNGSGWFKNNQRDDFLSADKVRKVKRFVFPCRSMNHCVLAASALLLCPSQASYQT